MLAILGLTAGLAPIAIAAGPPPAPGGVTVDGNGGFRLARQETTPDGRIAAHFTSGDAAVDTIGRPGMRVTINSVDRTTPDKPKERHADIEVTFHTPDLGKTAPGAAAAKGRSAVESLIALGVDPAIARRDFSSFDEASPSAGLDGQPHLALADPTAGSGIVLASAHGTAPQAAPAPTVSSTVPWDTQCANLSYASGKVTGRGCSTIYLIAATGGNWWLQSKYKITAQSSDTSLLPIRVKGLGWRIQWSANNEVTDWEPHTTIYGTSGCGTVHFSAEIISLDLNLCPTKESPWSLGQLSSGSLWSGTEHDTDVVGAGGVQEDHSPNNATSGHSSTFSLSY